MFERFTRLPLALALTGVLTACTTTDPYTGEKRTSKTGAGAVIGAVAGAVVGAASADDVKERRKRVLIGAGAGALSGAAIGRYMDEQERKLRERLQGSGVSVSREGDEIVLNMPGNITFQTDSAALNPEFFDVLDAVSSVLGEYEKTLIVISGHTDATGPDEYNQLLSERRAAAVGAYLDSHGVNDERMVIVGYGEAQPVAPNATPQGRAENRRVELVLEPLARES